MHGLMGIREHKHRLPKEIYQGKLSASFTLCVNDSGRLFVDPTIVKIFTDILYPCIRCPHFTMHCAGILFHARSSAPCCIGHIRRRRPLEDDRSVQTEDRILAVEKQTGNNVAEGFLRPHYSIRRKSSRAYTVCARQSSPKGIGGNLARVSPQGFPGMFPGRCFE